MENAVETVSRPAGGAPAHSESKAVRPALPVEAEPRSRPRKRYLILGGVTLAIVLIAGGWTLWTAGKESTDDAQIEADVVPVSTRVAGQVKRVAVADNAHVKKGELILELDDADSAARVQQAQAEVETAAAQAAAADAQAQVATAGARGGLTSAKAGVSGSSAQVATAKAGLIGLCRHVALEGARRAPAGHPGDGVEPVHEQVAATPELLEHPVDGAVGRAGLEGLDGLADVDELAGRHRTAVAQRANAVGARTRQHRPHPHLRNAVGEQQIDRRVTEIVTPLDDDVALLVDGVGGHAAVRRELAAGDGHQALLGGGDQVAAGEVGGLLRLAGNEWAQPGPAASDVGGGEPGRRPGVDLSPLHI